MQRVVRSTLVGLLTIAGLAACGDKVTVPGITTTPPDLTVKGVSVSPTNITLPVGSSLTVGASVDAGAGVTDRTVTWTSADASIATVGATDGKVTGVKAGVTSVTAASKADPTQKASVAVTVTPVNVNQPTVSISAKPDAPPLGELSAERLTEGASPPGEVSPNRPKPAPRLQAGRASTTSR